MRVLFLSVTAGEGHNSCAKAIMSALKRRGVECRMLSTLNYTNAIIGTSVDKGYLLMGKYSPKLFGSMYKAALATSVKGRINTTDLIAPLLAKKLSNYISIYEPDFIVCTHVFASLIITRLRQKYGLKIPTIGICTDFTIHPFWEEVDQDYMLLACDKMNYSALMRGLPSAQLLPFGIPVNEKFNSDIPAPQAREMLELPEKMTLTLMGGSMGFGNLLDAIRRLDTLPLDFQLVTICGNNKKMFNEIEKIRSVFLHTVHNRGFVSNVHEYMCAADVLLTKPGGLSVSECLLIRRPLVLLKPIPGQEEYNAAFLVNCGAAVETSAYYSLEEAIYNLLTSPERIMYMLQSQRSIYTGNASEKLADFLVELKSQQVDQQTE